MMIPKYENMTKLTATAAAVLLSVATALVMQGLGETGRIFAAVGTVVLVLLPLAAEKLFGCRISLPVYLFALLYAMGPMAGNCWYLYYTTAWWDKLLHCAGGMFFALVGAVCFDLLIRGKQKGVTRMLFALCFSITVAAVWEFVEFGMDTFLGMDMQNDTVITGFSSYLLGPAAGTTGSIENIRSVVIDGRALPVAGYLDIGIIDTMTDMLLGFAGALAVSLLLWLDAGKHPLYIPVGGKAAENKRA